MQDLTENDARILAFEEQGMRAGGRKDEAIRNELGISPARYYQRLNVLIDVPAAMAEYPSMTARLRRLRHRRAEERES